MFGPILSAVLPAVIGAATSGGGKKEKDADKTAGQKSKSGGGFKMADAAKLLPQYQKATGNHSMTVPKLKELLNKNPVAVMAPITGKPLPGMQTTTIIS